MPPKKNTKIIADKPVVTATHSDDEIAGRYKKVSHVDHILLRPEMYVGSIENHKSTVWLFDPSAVRVKLPDLLPPGQMENKLAQLGMGTVALIKKRGRAAADDDEESSQNLDDIEAAVEKELAEEDEVVLVNGVDSRLLASDEPVEAFGPGSQIVGSVFINPGLLKIVDEIVVNAADNRLVDSPKPQTYIRVTFDEKTGEITCQNDGAAIPIVMHPEHGIYVPEMIFGSLLTSSHYGNDPNSIAAGRHGFGAKLTNILSSRFTVECAKDGKHFKGVWSDNMKKRELAEAGAQANAAEGDFTKVSFVPEYSRFVAADLAKAKTLSGGVSSDSLIPSDFNIVGELSKILKRRLLDLSTSIGPNIKVYYNNELLTPRCFAEYVRMHMPADESSVARQPFVQHTKSSTGDVLLSEYGVVFRAPPAKGAVEASTNLNQHVSLVNGIVTHQGGTHLRHLMKAVDQALEEAAAHLDKEERLVLNTAGLKANLTLFVNALVHQSKFDSQSKDRLVSKHSYAPVKVSELTRHILLLPFLRSFCLTSDKMTAALESALATTQTRQKNLMRMFPKLVEPADMTIPMNRTLILTEGDSAKALALNSLSGDQRQVFGVLPLRGKLLNVRNAHPRKIAANKEIISVLATLGLSTKTKYANSSQLRYQRILIMTDQDNDGFHIRGLIISLINYYWPELMKAIPDYVSIFSTPLIKAQLKGEVTSFYCMADYKRWYGSLEPAAAAAVKVKYYKGLGTSSTEEGKEYFNSMEENIRFIQAADPEADADLMNNAFSNAPDFIRWRKKWVLSSKIADDMENGRGALTIKQFVDQQLVQFALADNLRSFPDVRDGLRSSHRKIIWAMLNRKSHDTMRVSQAAGYVSEVSNYHHGESSLLSAIINLAQTYVGSNNVPLLLGEGQFGSRINAGNDSAAPRYIFTTIAPIARTLFPIADDDLLTYPDQEGTVAEPSAFAPVVPIQFLNGSAGIGVGFASRHLPHDVRSVVAAVRAMHNGTPAAKAASLLKVGVTGFRGRIERCKEDHKRVYVSGDFELYATGPDMTRGYLALSSAELAQKYKESNFSLTQNTVIRITEIPFTLAIEDYRKNLANKLDDVIVTFADFSGANHVDIRVTVNTRDFFAKFKTVSRESILSYLGLTQSCSQYMMCVQDGTVKQHGSDYAEQLDRFYTHRLEVYGKRLSLNRERLAAEIKRLEGHIAFNSFVKAHGAKTLSMTEEELATELRRANVPAIEGSYKPYFSRSFSSLLKENAGALENKLTATKEALAHSEKNDTPTSLWADDLKTFESAYAKQEDIQLKSIMAEHKVKKNFGTKLTLPNVVEDLTFLGYSSERGWADRKIFKQKQEKERLAVTRMSTSKLTEEIEALKAEIKSAEKTLESAKKRSTVAVVTSLKIKTNNARLIALEKAIKQIEKMKKSKEGASSAAASASGSTSASSGPAAGGAVTSMLHPSVVASAVVARFATGLPLHDRMAIAHQRVIGGAVGFGGAIGARGLLRLFSRTFL